LFELLGSSLTASLAQRTISSVEIGLTGASAAVRAKCAIGSKPSHSGNRVAVSWTKSS
jgi:hypothetical protein